MALLTHFFVFCKGNTFKSIKYSLEIHELAILMDILREHKLEIPYLKEGSARAHFWLI